jgi:leucyl aminopeptidase
MQQVKKIALCAGFATLLTTHSGRPLLCATLDPLVWISLPQEAQVKSPVPLRAALTTHGVAIAQVPTSQLPILSNWMHETYHRCGGFFYENSLEGARTAIEHPISKTSFSYAVNKSATIPTLLAQVKESDIKTVIETLSAFQNRLYSSSHGVDSQTWVLHKWQELAAGREDISVELISHNGYIQPSVMLTIRGHETPDEIVVLGGHGDSILQTSRDSESRAPGADDNASGIATITEALHIIVSNHIQFKRTIKLFAYAAEEVGLRGSQDIANSFRQKNLNVQGVIQLDMTNYAGSPYDIVFMTDYVDANLTAYLQSLLKTHMPEVKWTTDRCGYACSDHASWTRNGYPSSMPFEARMHEHNPRIHTTRDTLEISRGRAEHAVPFAKLSIAYLMDLGRGTEQ